MNGLEEIEAHNLAEIYRLNQRGGRMLSFVDLIEAGTLSAELAGELAAMVEAGASILTAARLGGAGKSTALAGLLACLPPGERIVTTSDIAALEAAQTEAPAGRVCYLAHEIGAGHWYAYLWGKAAARFIGLTKDGADGRRIASCLHADEIDELYGILETQGAAPEAIRSIGIVLFMRRTGSARRVTSVYVPGREGHRVRWCRDETKSIFVPEGDAPVNTERAEEFCEFFEELAGGGTRDFAEVRRALLEKIRAPE